MKSMKKVLLTIQLMVIAAITTNAQQAENVPTQAIQDYLDNLIEANDPGLLWAL